MQSSIRTGVAICTPIPMIRTSSGTTMLEPVTVEWHRHRSALSTPTNYNTIEMFVDGLEVGAARNHAVERILAHGSKPKYLFFLDYDVLPHWDALSKLIYRAEHFPDHDIIAGVYCSKASPAEPLIYKGDGHGPFWDWTVGDLIFDITGVHMGLTLIRMSLFEKLAHTPENPWFFTTHEDHQREGGMLRRRGTEDLWFCRRAIQEAAAKIMVDGSVLAGHIQNSTGVVYGLPLDCGPVQRARWLRFGKEEQPTKRAIDLGAGSVRREWPDHETHTTDLRADCGPTYVMDTRWLNLPDDSFDLVASSHHLEHFGRFDQERIWSEIYRICKPGGCIEHIVPNLLWGSHKLIEVESGRDEDGFESTFNVFYGAQESHGYDRTLNTHYFGYTPRIARALAEQAGFQEVEIETYDQRPELGYNLVIRGRKPDPVLVSEQ